MKDLEIDLEYWEDIAADCRSWRCLLHKQLKKGEEKITNEAIEKKNQVKKENNNRLRRIYSHMLFMRQGLPFPRWPHKPQVALLRTKPYELTVIRNSFHGRLLPKEACCYFIIKVTGHLVMCKIVQKKIIFINTSEFTENNK